MSDPTLTYRGVKHIARRQDPDSQEWQVYRLNGNQEVQIGIIVKDDQDYRPFTVVRASGGRATEWDTFDAAFEYIVKTF